MLYRRDMVMLFPLPLLTLLVLRDVTAKHLDTTHEGNTCYGGRFCNASQGECFVDFAQYHDTCCYVSTYESCISRRYNQEGKGRGFSEFVRNSLNVSIQYIHPELVELTSNWKIKGSFTSSIWFYLTISEFEQYCICLPPNTTRVVARYKVQRNEGFRMCAYKPSSTNVRVNVRKQRGQKTYDLIYKDFSFADCWTDSGNKSLTRCGSQIPSQPVNLTATAVMLPSGNVTVTVRWDPPLYNNTPLHGYHIRAVLERPRVDVNKTIFWIDCHNGTQLTFKAAIPQGAHINIKVAANMVIQRDSKIDHDHLYSCYTISGPQRYCSIPLHSYLLAGTVQVTSAVVLPSNPWPTFNDTSVTLIVIGCSISGGIAVLAVMVTICIVLLYYTKRRPKATIRYKPILICDILDTHYIFKDTLAIKQ